MNTQKTSIIGLFAVILTLAFIACDSPTDAPVHVHQWGAWNVTTTANCTTTGLQTRTCALDATHTETEIIPIDDNAHDWGEWTGTVTCTTAGTGTRVCSRSKTHVETSNSLQPLGHAYNDEDWGETEIPTCSAEGTEEANCLRYAECGNTGTRAIAINPSAHHWGAWVETRAATETQDGEEKRTCAHNATHVETNALAALDHTHIWGGWEVRTPPACTEKGERERVCQTNSNHKDYEDINPIGHDAGVWHDTLAATCTANGTRELRCTRDNFVLDLDTESIAAIGHDWGNWSENQPADGREAIRCNHNSSHIKETRTVMVFVPGGTFQLGQGLGTRGGNVIPVSNVTLSGFYIGKYEVTQAQWQAVMESSLSHSWRITNDYGYGRGDAFPEYYVTWYDALVFCNKLSVMEGLTPAYRINNSTNPDDWGGAGYVYHWDWHNGVTIDSNANGYRLPTQAQWEYAAKGGNPLAPGWVGYTYAGSDTVGNVAWYYYNSGDNGGTANRKSHEVGTKAPNGLGLYDMSGNVAEWCWDWDVAYTSADKTDPIDGTPSVDYGYRLLRGGSWNTDHIVIGQIFAYPYDESGSSSNGNANFGLRVVRPMH